MTRNVKMDTVSRAAPVHGWAPKDSFHRVMSELDASTGKLTGDQQQVYADLPIEEFITANGTSQPGGHKIMFDDAGGCTYNKLQPVGDAWAHMAVYGV